MLPEPDALPEPEAVASKPEARKEQRKDPSTTTSTTPAPAEQAKASEQPDKPRRLRGDTESTPATPAEPDALPEPEPVASKPEVRKEQRKDFSTTAAPTEAEGDRDGRGLKGAPATPAEPDALPEPEPVASKPEVRKEQRKDFSTTAAPTEPEVDRDGRGLRGDEPPQKLSSEQQAETLEGLCELALEFPDDNEVADVCRMCAEFASPHHLRTFGCH